MRGGWKDQADGALVPERGPGGSMAGREGPLAVKTAQRAQEALGGCNESGQQRGKHNFWIFQNNGPISELRVETVQRQLDGGN